MPRKLLWAPTIPGLETADYLTAETIIDLIRPPKTLMVIGVGATGVQLAELFAIFGTKVYLLESKKRILPKQDDEVSEALSEIFRKQRGMEIITSASVVSLKKGKVRLRASTIYLVSTNTQSKSRKFSLPLAGSRIWILV